VITDHSSQERFAALLAYVEAGLSEPLNLAALARRFGASPFHFHHLFRKCMGETPRQYIERLRLERAFVRLTLTEDSVREIAHAVGYDYHETFTRSFKRRFQVVPDRLRRHVRAQREEQFRSATGASTQRCQLSNARFESLPPAFLLAKRRLGDYRQIHHAPFVKGDRLWTPVAHWAARLGLPHARLGWGLTYDFPGITPDGSLRFDACVRVDRVAPSSREIQCLRFEGGHYALIEHVGSPASLTAAYSALVVAINEKSNRYAWREGPSLTMYQNVHIGGDSQLNHTTVCIPVSQVRQRKKRQKVTRGAP
jgi:AraC family transcriptional regulator